LPHLFAALADPTRLRVLALLRAMELSVGEIALVLGQSQPRVSRHVKILCEAGLIERRKEGSWVFLGLGAGELVEPVFGLIDRWKLRGGADVWEADIERLQAVRAERAAAAQSYFAAHAGDWDRLRSLHVAEAEVEAAIARALAGGAGSGGRPIGRLVDVGTGTGRMIELFGGLADRALGIDRSPEMLRLARVKLAEAGLAAELRQGDMYALPMPAGAADTVILHQVLHYAQNPAAAVAEAGRLLAPGGRLLIADFAPHQREELRTRDAHVRLGFADDLVLRYLEQAGLDGQIVEHLGGGELTVTIWAGDRPETILKEVA
jgi:ArsR family transcriptional regulator